MLWIAEIRLLVILAKGKNEYSLGIGQISFQENIRIFLSDTDWLEIDRMGRLYFRVKWAIAKQKSQRFIQNSCR